MRPVLAWFFALALFAPSNTLPQVSSGARYQMPSARNDGWSTADADSVGIDSGRLANLTQAVRTDPSLGVHAILIERNGKLVYEEYFEAADERWGTPLGRVSMKSETMHDLRSVTKSVVSALVGIARGEGAIKSLDQPLLSWFPEYAEFATPERKRVTLAHALSMTAGLEWNEDLPYTDSRNDEIRMNRDARPLRYALSRPLVADPGRDFRYNGGLPQAMAAVVQRATKTPFQAYARAKLFEPLGIDSVEWVGSLGDLPSAASGLRLRPRDLAKIGSLYLHEGRWNGKQVIPAEWIDLSTRRQVRIGSPVGADSEFGYGYFWWYVCGPTSLAVTEARVAIGNGGQRITLYPGLNMVVTLLAGRYNDRGASLELPRRILREHVLPAVKGDI